VAVLCEKLCGSMRDIPSRDIVPLSEAFLSKIGRGPGRVPAAISRDARQLLLEYHWLGNVRELRNVLERAAILCDGGLITSDHLAITTQAPVVATPAKPVAAPAAADATSTPSRSKSARPSVDGTRNDRSGAAARPVQQVQGGKSAWADASATVRSHAQVRAGLTTVDAADTSASEVMQRVGVEAPPPVQFRLTSDGP
jgi:DNA-binding NtrC family response regulator